MDQVISTVGGALGGFFDSPIVSFGLRAMAAYIVVVWLATAYWAFRDMQTRSDNPILPYLAASLIILFTPVLFIFAALIYRLIRPHEKIGEAAERSLAEEALLNEVEAVPHCPGCARRVADQWLICPTCRTRLNRVCPNCNRLVGLDWSLCAWCGKDFERRDLMPVTIGATPAPYPVAAAVSAGASISATSASSAPAPVSIEADGAPTTSRRSTRTSGTRAARSASDPLPER
jgi:RNA polymerase subunit RPABC4/transcription elongation factor Spt4